MKWAEAIDRVAIDALMDRLDDDTIRFYFGSFLLFSFISPSLSLSLFVSSIFGVTSLILRTGLDGCIVYIADLLRWTKISIGEGRMERKLYPGLCLSPHVKLSFVLRRFVDRKDLYKG